MNSKLIAWILWPAFLAAAAGEILFFSVFDPSELSLFGAPLGVSRLAVYSIGFFLFWLLAAASSAMTCLLQRSAEAINRCPFPAQERPAGCAAPRDERACR